MRYKQNAQFVLGEGGGKRGIVLHNAKRETISFRVYNIELNRSVIELRIGGKKKN